jgi:hypothetical protein
LTLFLLKNTQSINLTTKSQSPPVKSIYIINEALQRNQNLRRITQMKKMYFTFVFFAFCGIFVFGNNDMQEVDHLLFMPNSGSRFVNEKQALIQLDNLARYLSNKNLIPGQIIVCGYAAYAPNKIEPVDLSRERALFVMNELQKRGISKDLFSEPAGYGAVYLWGNNTSENTREPNRRVRILLDSESPIPVTPEIITAETEFIHNVIEEPAALEIVAEAAPLAEPMAALKRDSSKFSWWILPVLGLFLLFLLLLKEKSRKLAHKDEAVNAQPQIPITDTEPAPAVTTWMVNLDEEIRCRAYELSQQRNGSGDYQDEDWYKAVHEISAWYTACGHSVFTDGGYWWASRSYNY